MASEDMGLVPPQRLDTNGLTSQMVFQQEGLRFSSRPIADPSPKTRELSGFIDDRYFQSQGAAADFRRSLYVDDGNRLVQSLNGNGQGGGEGSEGDEEEEDDDDDEDDEEDDVDEREGEILGHLLVWMMVIFSRVSNRKLNSHNVRAGKPFF